MFSGNLQQFLEKYSATYGSIEKFLINIHKLPKQKRFRFMDALFESKKELIKNFHCFVQLFDNFKDFTNWYFDIYLDMYSDWLSAQFEKNPIEKCLEIIPSITPWYFESKCPKLEIGEIPTSFISKEVFLLLLDQILISATVINFKKIKDLEITAPEAFLTKKQLAAKKVDVLNEKTKAMKKLLKENMGDSFKITIQKRSFEIQPLFNPFSNKLVLQITTPDKKAFIIKMSLSTTHVFLTDEARKQHENQLLRADSPYSNALVDFYLKFNQCPMGADILYYNFNYDVVLYQKTKGTAYHFPNKKHSYPNLVNFNMTQVSEISKLGLFLNDVHESNFIYSQKTCMPVLIDSGHITYLNPLNPGRPGLTFTLGNLSGRDALSHFGVLICKDL